MARNNKLNYFAPIDVPQPVDQVIEQIHTLILNGHIKPGEKLPSSKKLEERMGLPRGVINRALSMMETYGIVKTVPQSGTYVADICVEALDGLISNIIALKIDDIDRLAEVRFVMESFALEEVVDNATDSELEELEKIQTHMREKYENGEANFDLDLVFHLKIAAFSGNPVLKSVLTRLIVDIINLLDIYATAVGVDLLAERMEQAVEEHNLVVERLMVRDKDGAVAAIQAHFNNSKAFRARHSI